MRASKHVLALMLALVWPALGSAAETMRAISFIPKNDPVLAMANAWAAEVNAKLGSQLRINYVGGPEVIGRFQQVEALRTGVIDVIFVPSGDYQDQMPAAQTFVGRNVRSRLVTGNWSRAMSVPLSTKRAEISRGESPSRFSRNTG